MDDIELYKNFIDKTVLVKCQDGAEIRGTCMSLDGYLNIVLKNVEYDDKKENSPLKLANCFVKGSFLNHIELANN